MVNIGLCAKIKIENYDRKVRHSLLIKLNFSSCYCHQLRIHFLSDLFTVFKFLGRCVVRPYRLQPRAPNCLQPALIITYSVSASSKDSLCIFSASTSSSSASYSTNQSSRLLFFLHLFTCFLLQICLDHFTSFVTSSLTYPIIIYRSTYSSDFLFIINCSACSTS